MTRQRQASPFVVLTFATTHATLAAERLLLDLGVPLSPVPAPAHVTRGCGISLKLERRDLSRVRTYLKRAEIAVVDVSSWLDT